jgi:3-oxoacyl-[acyl-carrier-protein] synthase II
MKLALEEAGIYGSQVGYVNMHATSTLQGDISELKAVDTLFGKRSDLVLGATKSMTGHLLGAAGAIEAIIAILSLKYQVAPPLINTKNIESDFADAFNFSLDKITPLQTEYAMSNTFGFGGHIASVVIRKNLN